MLLGVPRNMDLTGAKKAFILDCRAAGISPKKIRSCQKILTSFINFVGDMRVRELGPDHVRLYIAELTDRVGTDVREKVFHKILVKHYAIVRIWLRWMYAQKLINQRDSEITKAPRLATRSLFPMT